MLQFSSSSVYICLRGKMLTYPPDLLINYCCFSLHLALLPVDWGSLWGRFGDPPCSGVEGSWQPWSFSFKGPVRVDPEPAVNKHRAWLSRGVWRLTLMLMQSSTASWWQPASCTVWPVTEWGPASWGYGGGSPLWPLDPPPSLSHR